MDGKARAGVFRLETGIHKALRSYPPIFQAEIHVIEACGIEFAKTGHGKKMYIMANSRRDLRLLEATVGAPSVKRVYWQTKPRDHCSEREVGLFSRKTNYRKQNKKNHWKKLTGDARTSKGVPFQVGRQDRRQCTVR